MLPAEGCIPVQRLHLDCQAEFGVDHHGGIVLVGLNGDQVLVHTLGGKNRGNKSIVSCEKKNVICSVSVKSRNYKDQTKLMKIEN